MVRRPLALIVLAAAVLALGACTAPVQASWPQFRGANGTGVAVGETAISKANVANLTMDYSATLGDPPGYTQSIPQPAVANGRVYVMSPGTLRVFDAAGVAGCASAPKTCEPLWTAALFGPGGAPPQGARLQSTPAVVGSYVLVTSDNGNHLKLEAFDAAGVRGCSGTPTTCTPLWSTPELGLSGHPVVANGFVYAEDTEQRVAAFDVNGVQGCGGAPVVCQPVWTSSAGTYAMLATADGVLLATPYPTYGQYPVVDEQRVYAYDAVGQQGCAGSPRVCEPLWRSEPLDGGSGGSSVNGYAVIDHGRAYVSTYFAPGFSESGTEIRVYDLQGGGGCGGVPVTCTPLWVNRFDASSIYASARMNGPAVANGVLYAFSNLGGPSPRGDLAAFDATGSQGCQGTPLVCSPLWHASYDASYPVVANGVLFAGTRAFDAAGTDNCGGAPKTCSPLWQDPSALDGASAVAQGRVFSVVQVAVNGPLQLRVYRLP